MCTNKVDDFGKAFYSLIIGIFPYMNICVFTDFYFEIYNKMRQRAYHNIDHIFFMYREFNEYLKFRENDLSIAEVSFLMKSIPLSIFFHDVEDTVEGSVDVVKNFYSMLEGFNGFKYESFMDEVIFNIYSTNYEKVNCPTLLTDLDLAILGKSRDIYEKYSTAVRVEYRDNWSNDKRKSVLRLFLNKSNIYYTDYFREKYEIQARENINWELKLMENMYEGWRQTSQ